MQPHRDRDDTHRQPPIRARVPRPMLLVLDEQSSPPPPAPPPEWGGGPAAPGCAGQPLCASCSSKP